MRMPSTVREMLIAAALLAGFALAGTALVAYIHQATEARIEANQRAETRARLTAMLPAGSYDNDIVADTIRVKAPGRLGSDKPLPVYRARKDGEPVAAVLTAVAPNGYNGPIRLLVAVRHDGSVAGVRVLRHQETPGLGDVIEYQKSDWLQRFTGRSLGNPPVEDWQVAKDGGAFDQVTGATITSRAVVQALREALLYFRSHRDALFRPSEAD